MAQWGYGPKNGPEKWSQWFPVATAGHRQSPIDLEEDNCLDAKGLPPLAVKYTPCAGLPLENTGFSWKVNFLGDLNILQGGPLSGEYKLEQMHAHWGARQGRGSEHTLNGKMFDGELHLVHYNSAYGSFGQAVDKPDGLAVLGIFLEVGAAHPELGKVTSLLEKVNKKGENIEVEEEIDPSQLLPGCDCYFTYPGSLTTPPLFESVTWLVYKDPITISEDQLASMRSLLAGSEAGCDCVVDNYRPVCPRGKRQLKKAVP